MSALKLQSARLVLRPWRDDDLPAFAALNADPEVMAHFPACLSRAESDGVVARIRQHFAQEGFGAWVLERRDNGQFIGVCGLQRVGDDLPCAPAVEIAWRLARAHWGQGLAREAAAAALQYAFTALNLPQVVSFTTLHNLRSQRLMQALGMQHQPNEAFDHPHLTSTDPLRPHVLYRLLRSDWQARHGV